MKICENGIMRDMTAEEIAAMEAEVALIAAENAKVPPAVHREQAYNTDSIIPWGGEHITVTEAAQKWQYYAAEGNTEKMDALTAIIAAAKADIRAKYPDNAGGT